MPAPGGCGGSSEAKPSVSPHKEEPPTIVVLVDGPIERADVPRLCGRVRRLLERSDVELVVCDLGALVEPDVVTVDALARLQLIARRLGRQIRLRHACDELRDLLVLVGLCDVLPLCSDSAVEPTGEAEQWEQAGGVEKEGDPADPPG